MLRPNGSIMALAFSQSSHHLRHSRPAFKGAADPLRRKDLGKADEACLSCARCVIALDRDAPCTRHSGTIERILDWGNAATRERWGGCMTDPIRLAELICARLCHDLSGPLGPL